MNAKLAELVLVVAALLGPAARAFADDFPPRPEHDLVVKSCTSCHDAGTVTSQHMSAQNWADTVKQMVANGAPVSGADINKVVTYLAEHFGPTQTPTQVQPGNGPAHSPLDVPGYAPLTWRKVEGQPIDTRWPEKQDDAPEFPGQTRAPYHASVPYTTTIITDKL